MDDQFRYYKPFVSPLDPCPPIPIKSYNVPLQLFINFQPPDWPQYQPHEALKKGTLWPALFAPYPDPLTGT
ncbi:spore coat associated protein CotJA [Paenibacillus sp. CAU 1782]